MNSSPGFPTRDDVLPKQEYLQENQLFAGLSDDQLREADEFSAMTRCERGKVFFRPEDSPGTVYFLKEGRVRLYRQTSDGKQLTVASLDRGSVFGESALIGQSHAGVYAEAAEECILCVMPSANLKDLIARFPQIGLNLLEYVGTRLRRSQELSEEVAYWSVRRRLARLILELDERYGHPTLGGGRIINKTLTQVELADMVGSTRETVAEMLGTLRKQGILGQRRRRIVVEDMAALQSLLEDEH